MISLFPSPPPPPPPPTSGKGRPWHLLSPPLLICCGMDGIPFEMSSARVFSRSPTHSLSLLSKLKGIGKTTQHFTASLSSVLRRGTGGPSTMDSLVSFCSHHLQLFMTGMKSFSCLIAADTFLAFYKNCVYFPGSWGWMRSSNSVLIFNYYPAACK